jgi:glyoxylase-like metal-dependent hydrolase (beta-lactamase superfamily II)
MPDSHDQQRLLAQLQFPCGDPPEGGALQQVADGVYWLRMPLPFQLNHINLWLVEESDGWTIVDCGINLPDTRAHWETIFSRELKGKPVTRVISTHMHPDHVGLAGWLCERWKAPLWMTMGEFLSTLTVRASLGEGGPEMARAFQRMNGVPEESLKIFERHRNGFAAIVAPLPASYRRLVDGERFKLGGRNWQVIVGHGHAPEHVSLWCGQLNLLIAGDQVLPKISTNVGVWPNMPDDNALQWFLDDMHKFRPLPEDALVLPSHGPPFVGLHRRLDQLVAHHDERLHVLRAACAARGELGASGWQMTPVLFQRHLDGSQVVFAFGETIAHMHCLQGRGEVARVRGSDGVLRFVSTGLVSDVAPIVEDNDAPSEIGV